MDSETLKSLHTNQRLLLKELKSRGVEVTLLVKELELVEATYMDHRELILDRDSSATPYAGAVLVGDKYITKKLLSMSGLPVPRGEQFFADQLQDALRYAFLLPKPVVIKPSNGSHGEGCYTDCETEEEIQTAIDGVVALIGSSKAFLIEEQRPGMEFRVFITRNRDFAVLYREPAFVVGDGEHSIGALVEIENYRRMNPRKNSLCPIILDGVAERFLARLGLSFNSIPYAEEKVHLRGNSNVAHGGLCFDFTEDVHPSMIQMAYSALCCIPRLNYAGVDIISRNFKKEQTPEDSAILEVNSNPGFHMHMRPASGQPRNVASYLADIIFPETRRLQHDSLN